MTKEELQNHYRNELKYFSGEDFDASLKLMLNDLINHTETAWDLFGIRYDSVMSKEEWENFINHPERIPYQTKISDMQNKSTKEIYSFISGFLKDVFAYYKSLPDSDFKIELRKLINALIETTFNSIYQIEELRDTDLYAGRSIEDRDNGIIEISNLTKNKYEYAITEYARETQKNSELLKQKIMDLCQNDLRRIGEVSSSCVLDYETRLELKGISEIIARDLTLSFGDIKRGWRVWKEFRKIGIDTEEYLKLLGLPDFETVKRRLENFVKNKTHIDEMLNHLKDDLPECYEKYQNEKFITPLDIIHENAKRKNYPSQLRTAEEINKMVKEVEKEVFSLFPLAKNPTPRNIILTPTHPSSTSRAFNSTIKNSNRLPVNTIVMTPRIDNYDTYVSTFAHEVTHALHRKILQLGEENGALKPGSADGVSSAVMEDFSQLVDSQFKGEEKAPYKKQYNGKTFANFWSGYVTRFQVPFSLTQLSIRKEFDEMSDKQTLTETDIWNLKYKFDNLTREWLSMGVNIKSDITSFNLFDSYNPSDGVVYMRTYMMQENSESNTNETEENTMQEAFKKRWGNQWVKEKDARILLHWLLLETGRNENTETYYQFILNKPIDEALSELEKITLKESDII
jgi:hypothetical protein